MKIKSSVKIIDPTTQKQINRAMKKVKISLLRLAVKAYGKISIERKKILIFAKAARKNFGTKFERVSSAMATCFVSSSASNHSSSTRDGSN